MSEKAATEDKPSNEELRRICNWANENEYHVIGVERNEGWMCSGRPREWVVTVDRFIVVSKEANEDEAE